MNKTINEPLFKRRTSNLFQAENKVINEFAMLLNISPMQIIQNDKSSEISDIRHLYCKLRHERHGLTFSAIGREIKRNYKTVKYGVMRINDLLLMNDKKTIAMWCIVRNISELYPARNDATLIES